MDDLIRIYLEEGKLKNVEEKDYFEVVMMYEDIKAYLGGKEDIKNYFEFNGISVNYIEISLILSKSFFVNHGMFNYINFVDAFYNFLTLCENGYFGDIITPENLDRTLIYLFIGYAVKSNWFLPMDINLNNMTLSLN